MLGIEVSQATVGRYMPWRSKVPSPTWRSFLHNHMRNMAAVDMFVVATATLGDVDVQYVWRFLREHNIDLTARKSWCESNDPAFAAKAADVVGLYVDPPAKAIVLCVDEKPSIQALERAQGYLKLPNGRALTGQSHDYKRHGTTTLFAALDVATGRIIAAHSKRRRRVEFLGFMNSVVTAFPDRELHVILGSCQGSDYGDDRHEDRKFHVSARSLLKPSADPKESPELAPEICTGR
jgi:hypothetical protein